MVPFQIGPMPLFEREFLEITTYTKSSFYSVHFSLVNMFTGALLVHGARVYDLSAK